MPGLEAAQRDAPALAFHQQRAGGRDQVVGGDPDATAGQLARPGDGLGDDPLHLIHAVARVQLKRVVSVRGLELGRRAERLDRAAVDDRDPVAERVGLSR